jgi:hypothetical protein
VPVEEQPCRFATARTAGDATDQWQTIEIVVGALHEIRDREGEGIGEQHRNGVVVTPVWHPGNRRTVKGAYQLQVQWSAPDPRQACRERTHRGSAFDPSAGADHTTSATTQGCAGSGQRHGAGARQLDHCRIVTADEHAQQIRALPVQRGQRLCDGGFGRRR